MNSSKSESENIVNAIIAIKRAKPAIKKMFAAAAYAADKVTEKN